MMDRYSEDFELWCRECVTVTDKLTGAPVSYTHLTLPTIGG